MSEICLIVLNDFTRDTRVMNEAQSLRAMGHSVAVVALWREGLEAESRVDGIRVVRVKLNVVRGIPRPLFQGLKYLQFLTKSIRIVRAADVVQCNDVETLPVGVFAKVATLGRSRLVYDAHELESGKMGLSRGGKLVVWAVEKSFLPIVNGVMTVSPGIADYYSHRYGVPRPAVVMNCPPYLPPVRTNSLRENLGIPAEKRIFLYQGLLVPGRGVELLLSAFAREDCPSQAVLVVMGYGSLEMMVRSYAQKCSKIYFHPAVEPGVLTNFTASADIGVCLIEDSCLSYRYALPNKLFQYMMAGLPVICSDLPEMRRVVEDYNTGVLVSPHSESALFAAIHDLAAADLNPYRDAATLASSEFCWERQEPKIKDVYRKASL